MESVRQWDAEIEAEHGADAVWLACSHGDVIKAIVADALGLHLDNFQRTDLPRPDESSQFGRGTTNQISRIGNQFRHQSGHVFPQLRRRTRRG